MTKTTTVHIVSLTLLLAVAGLVLLALPGSSSAHGKDHASHATSTEKTRKGEVRGNNVDATCMQTAVATREESLSSSWSTFSASMTSALTARKSSLNTAWGLTDTKTRNTELATSWKNWKSATKDANTTMKKERKTAWDTFRTTAKDSCKMTTPKEEALPKDEAGSIAL